MIRFAYTKFAKYGNYAYWFPIFEKIRETICKIDLG